MFLSWKLAFTASVWTVRCQVLCFPSGHGFRAAGDRRATSPWCQVPSRWLATRLLLGVQPAQAVRVFSFSFFPQCTPVLCYDREISVTLESGVA